MQHNLNSEKELLIEIMKVSLKPSGELVLPGGLDFQQLSQLIKKQHLELMVYPMLSKQTDEKCLELAKSMESRYHNLLFKSVVQENEIENLLNSMEKERIEVLPLKGWVMRHYYPDPFMRIMTDLDVLLKDFEESKIRCFMEKLGFEAEVTGDDHHDIYKKDGLIAELHKRLSDSKIELQKPKIDLWLDEIWSRCVKKSGTEAIYELSKEDFYVYNLIHFYKHLRNSGAGIRALADVYVFLKKEEQFLDWNYVESVLSDIELKKFEAFVRNLSLVCFEEESFEPTEEQRAFLALILSGGLFGSKKIGTSTQLVEKEKGNYGIRRFAVLWKVIFQSADILKHRYPILKKHGYLLPAVWILRIFRILFRESWKISVISDGSSKKSYDELSEIFKNAGVD